VTGYKKCEKRKHFTTPIHNLTDCEFDVFCWIGQGNKPSMIAKRMHLSVKTVEKYIVRIREKLDLADSPELLRYAIKWAGGADRL